jgi:hypothetical protein
MAYDDLPLWQQSDALRVWFPVLRAQKIAIRLEGTPVITECTLVDETVFLTV